MPKREIDFTKLLGFRLLTSGDGSLTGAKSGVGVKEGVKIGPKPGFKPDILLGAKSGEKLPPEFSFSKIGSKVGAVKPGGSE